MEHNFVVDKPSHPNDEEKYNLLTYSSVLGLILGQLCGLMIIVIEYGDQRLYILALVLCVAVTCYVFYRLFLRQPN